MPKLISSNQGALLKGSELVKILVGSGDGDLNKKKIASSGKNSLAERTVPVLTRSIQVITDSIIRAACIQVLFSAVYHLKSAILPHSSDLLTLSMKALPKGTHKEKMAAIKLLVLEQFLHIVQGIFCDSNLLPIVQTCLVATIIDILGFDFWVLGNWQNLFIGRNDVPCGDNRRTFELYSKGYYALHQRE
ncbi:hypothetical protein GIB67_011579 [Kingdonia uniflora]|uniref:Uncharacterized protein n=1 Tax=Kingdonia uniflora TaxID=39325 RepID=A0A7J7NMI0_9MAGN|nr:hypothetical protein GIB67_011579 [Kingdonia uniflora]